MEILERLKNSNIPKGSIWINEALFGFEHISPLLASKKKLRVLEIGCGGGILLALLKEKYPDHHYVGVEPYEGSFESLREINDSIQDKSINVLRQGYEDFEGSNYDLVFSVNVVEHLKNWPDFIKKSSSWLNEAGKLVILCPNYGFPYESHFNLPVVLNKSITFWLFEKKIKLFEQKHDSEGLWDTLNFITLSKLKAVVSRENLKIKVNHQIFTDMISRLSYDSEFSKRHKTLGFIAKNLTWLNFSMVFKISIFEDLIPYMLVVIHRNSDDANCS